MSLKPQFSNAIHTFDTGIALHFKDVNVAIVLSHIIFWLRINKAKGANQVDGKTWMYETLENMAAQFEYLSIKQVRHCIDLLVESGMILKNHLGKNNFDRTCWYTLSDETPLNKIKSTVSPEGQIDKPCEANGLSEKGKSDLPSEANDLYSKDKKKDKEKAPNVAYISFGSHVKLTKEKYDELKKEITQLDDLISQMNDYLAMHGKNYKDYSAALRKWSKERIKKEVKPSKENEDKEFRLSDEDRQQMEASREFHRKKNLQEELQKEKEKNYEFNG